MKIATKVLGTCLAAALSLAMMAPMARADARNQMTEFTFSAPVHIPGNRVLPAGTYWFKVLDSPAMQNVIEVYNADRSKLDATVIAGSADRMNPTSSTQLTLARNPKNDLTTLINWYYPGRVIGHAFIYSPKTERRIQEEQVAKVILPNQVNGY